MLSSNKNLFYGDADGLRLLSRNAVLSFVLSNRNYGKTWTFKKRAVKRALKHGKKTIWLRFFKNEKKEAIATFFTSADLQKYCGLDPYDKKDNPNGNFYRNGNTFYIRKKNGKGKWGRWQWFIKVYALSDAGAVRSADDVAVDTIVFDEFMKTPTQLARYPGNPVTDFLDMFVSIKRRHEVRCILLGNKESVSNPFFTYFGIKPLPARYEGVRSFRNGGIAVQQINNKPNSSSDYDGKVDSLFAGTAYGNYLYSSDYKNTSGVKKAKTPPQARIYTQVDIKGYRLKISTLNGLFYVNSAIDEAHGVFVDVVNNRHRHESELVKRYKRIFVGLVDAIADNRIRYNTDADVESMAVFKHWLST